MIEAGRALAFLRGRDYVLPEDVIDVIRRRAAAPHRALLRGAVREGTSADDLIRQILKAVPAPEKMLESPCQASPASAPRPCCGGSNGR